MASSCSRLVRCMQVGLRYHSLRRIKNAQVLCQIPAMASVVTKPKFYASEAQTQARTAGVVDGTSTFLSKLFGTGEEETRVTSEEEKQERQKLLDEVYEMYFAKPPREPDLEFYKQAFELLIKYQDKQGVETVWRILESSKVVPDEDLISKVEDFLIEAKERSWF